MYKIILHQYGKKDGEGNYKTTELCYLFDRIDIIPFKKLLFRRIVVNNHLSCSVNMVSNKL